MIRPTRGDAGGRAYLDPQNLARRQGRGTEQLLVIYVLERFLARLAASPHADRFVLKGGMLLAVWQARRATVDGDFLARNVHIDETAVLSQICEIAATAQPVDDGVDYLIDTARAGTIREGDLYGGVRITMDALVSRSRVKLRLDISAGDPVTPAPVRFDYPTLRTDHPDVQILGYPLQVVLAEKICTAVQLGSGNSRVRDYADLWTLTGTRDIAAADVLPALHATATYRNVIWSPIEPALAGFAHVRQNTYASYRLRLGPDGNLLPADFDAVVQGVIAFADPLLTGTIADAGTWSADERSRIA